MPLLLADLIYSRDCKLNLRKNVDTTKKPQRVSEISPRFFLWFRRDSPILRSRLLPILSRRPGVSQGWGLPLLLEQYKAQGENHRTRLQLVPARDTAPPPQNAEMSTEMPVDAIIATTAGRSVDRTSCSTSIFRYFKYNRYWVDRNKS